MSVYTDQVLVEKLNRMSNSQQSIETLSHWIIYHKKNLEKTVKIWEREIYKAPQQRKLIFLYLANDVMQSSRKKGTEFIKEFSKILKPCLVHVYREGNAQKEINRLFEVWKERSLFSQDYVDDIKKALRGEVTPAPIHSPLDSSPAEIKPLIPPSLMSGSQLPNDPAFLSLGESIQKIQESEVKNAFLLDEITSYLTQGNSSPDRIQVYINELTTDVERRNQVVNKLTEILAEHQSALTTRQNLLEQLMQSQPEYPVEENNPNLKRDFQTMLTQTSSSTMNYPMQSIPFEPKKQKTNTEPPLQPSFHSPTQWNPLPGIYFHTNGTTNL